MLHRSRALLVAAFGFAAFPALASAQQPTPPAPAVAQDSVPKQSLLGCYEPIPGRCLTISVDKDTLYGTTSTGDRKKLTLQSGTTYAVEGTAMTVTFTIGADGKAKELTMRQGGNERVLPRIP
jgi:hypothetical protein